MRKKGTNTPHSDASPTASSFDLSGKPSLTSASSSSSPFGHKIRPYILKNPSTDHREAIVISSNDSFPLQKRNIPKRPDPLIKLRLDNKSSKQRSSITPVRPLPSSSNKENVPFARSCKSIPTTPIRSAFGSSRVPTRSPPLVHHAHRVSLRVDVSTQTRPLAGTKRASVLKPVQPLRIMKKIGIKKTFVQATGNNSPSQRQRMLQPQSNTSNWPR